MTKSVVVLYANNLKSINNTINDIRNCSKFDVILLNDTGTDIKISNVGVLTTNRIGYSKTCNAAIDNSNYDNYYVLKHPILVTPEIFNIDISEDTIYGATIHNLNIQTWSIGDFVCKGCGFRWDLSLFDYKSKNPVIHGSFVAFTKNTFNKLRFDDNLRFGDGAVIDFCLSARSKNINIDVSNTIVGVGDFTSADDDYDYNKAYIASKWFGEYKYKCLSNQLCKDVVEASYDFNEYIGRYQPELLSDRFKGIATSKSVSLINDGSSVSIISNHWMRSDIVISINNSCLKYESDYYVSDDINIVRNLLELGVSPRSIVVPYYFQNHIGAVLCAASDINVDLCQLEVADFIYNVGPPFIGGSALSMAAHFAIYMNAKRINVFGFDGVDASDASKPNEYSGELDKLRALSELARKNDISILMTNFV